MLEARLFEMADRNFVASIGRGLSVLAAFTPAAPRLTLTEIATKTGMPKSSAFRIIYTLRKLGFLGFDPGDERFFPGPRCMALGFSALRGMDMVEIARPYLLQLANETGEVVNLAVRDGDEAVYCARIGEPKIININAPVGTRHPLAATAVGRVFLSFLPEVEREDVLRRMAADSRWAAAAARTRQLLRTTLSKGYTLIDNENESGIRAVAAPVWGADGALAAAVSVPVPVSRVSLRDLEHNIAPQLLRCARAISLSLGASEDQCVPETEADASADKRRPAPRRPAAR